MTRSSLSTLKVLSKSDHSQHKTDQILSEIEVCFSLIDSAKSSKSIEHDFVSVNNNNQAHIVFGRIVSEFTDILRKCTLTSLKEVMSMDHQYLSGNKLDQINTDISEVNSSIELSAIKLQLREIERWLGD